jgi:polyhydroxybutyrate depolymerase
VRKIIWLTVVAIVSLGVAGFALVHLAGTHPAKASVRVATKTTYRTLTAGGRQRGYDVIAPASGLPASAPVIVVLSGYGAAVPGEIKRDQLTPYVSADDAELVYPVPVYQSWNAGSCCGYASDHKVDDAAFLKALVPRLDAGGQRQVDVVGFSNGARLAYRIACTDPALFDAYVMVKGVPLPGCVVRKPVTLIELASVNDPEIPYRPGVKGLEPLDVTTEVTRLHATDGCPGTSYVTQSHDMTLTSWSGCSDGTRLVFAVWPGGKHLWPRPPVTKQAAAPEIWSFLSQTALAPLP